VRHVSFLVLIMVACLAFSCRHPKPPVVTEPSEECTPEQMKTASKVSPEEYWQIQLERQYAMRDYLKETLAIYRKYRGRTPEAQSDLLALEKQHQARMVKILTDRGLTSTADLMLAEPCRMQTLQERQKYMQEHPELREKFMAVSTENRDLKDEIEKFNPPCED
jgi:hypothetical protein